MPGSQRRAAPWLAASLSLALLGVATTAGGFSNSFVQDELPLILKNRTIHTLTAPSTFFTQPYWTEGAVVASDEYAAKQLRLIWKEIGKQVMLSPTPKKTKQALFSTPC